MARVKGIYLEYALFKHKHFRQFLGKRLQLMNKGYRAVTYELASHFVNVRMVCM